MRSLLLSSILAFGTVSGWTYKDLHRDPPKQPAAPAPPACSCRADQCPCDPCTCKPCTCVAPAKPAPPPPAAPTGPFYRTDSRGQKFRGTDEAYLLAWIAGRDAAFAEAAAAQNAVQTGATSTAFNAAAWAARPPPTFPLHSGPPQFGGFGGGFGGGGGGCAGGQCGR